MGGDSNLQELIPLLFAVVNAKLTADDFFHHFERQYQADGDEVALATAEPEPEVSQPGGEVSEPDGGVTEPDGDGGTGTSTTPMTLTQLMLIGATAIYAVGRMRY